MKTLKIPFPFTGRVTMKDYKVFVNNNIDAPFPLTVGVTVEIPFSHCLWEGEVNGEICEVRQLGTGNFQLIPIKT